MSSPYPFWRTARWPYDFLNPYHGTDEAHFPSPRCMDLRAVETPMETKRLCFVGDLMVSQADTPPAFCPRIRALMATADLIVATCEAPVSHAPSRREARYFSKFVMPRDYLLRVIDALAMDPRSLVFSLANNHINDNAFAGIVETLALLDALEIRVLGIRREGTSGVDRLDVGGLPLAFAAWTQWMNDRSVAYEGLNVNWQKDVPDLVAQLAEETEALRVAVPHWGHEFRHVPRAEERDLANKLLRADAFDLVIGSHTHSVQGLELIDGRLCAYSLGNFVFAQAPFLGLARAWSLGLVPLLLVDVVKPEVGRVYVARYQLELFYQSGSIDGTAIAELEQLPASQRAKLDRLIGRIFV